MSLKSPIDEFMETYSREYDFYERLALLCHQQCETALRRSGIRSLVTSRAKRPDSLRKKLEHRDRDRPYETVQAIRDDIVDLAGVRIATYFPTDRDAVDDIIGRNFDVRVCRKFPKKSDEPSALSWSKRFSGYRATHYRLTLRPNDTSTAERYCTTLVEIQVASVLMHAWSEVEHDLIYKPDSGTPSDSEQAILDEVNGMVLAGEIALERLQTAMRQRIEGQIAPFRNHYELAAYLHSLTSVKAGSNAALLMGRADILHEFLSRVQRCRPSDITELLQEWTLDTIPSHGTVVEQVVNHILRLHGEWLRVYEEARQAVGERNPYADADEASRREFDQFMTFYTEFERALSAIISHHDVENVLIPRRLGHLLERLSDDSDPAASDIKAALMLRNQVIHRGTRPDVSVLATSTVALQRAIADLGNEASPLLRLVERVVDAYEPSLSTSQRPVLPLDEAVSDFKRRYTMEALNQFGGNRTQTAKALGVDPRTIFRFLEKERAGESDEDRAGGGTTPA